MSNAGQENYIDPKEYKAVNSSNIQEENSLNSLRKLRLKNVNKVIIGNININSLPAKFNQVKKVILKNVDILVITETKLDDTFPLGQFYVEGFTMPYRRDSNRNGRGVIIYVREDIPSKILEKHKLPRDVEGMFVKLNFKKTKWLLFGPYHPLSQNDQYYFEALDKALDCYSSYDRIVLIGDFNSEDHETCMETFLYQHNFTNIVKEGTCFKNSSKSSTIDLFLTNNSSYFQNTKIFFTGLPDFHKLVTRTLKISIPKNKPLQINYRNYKHFNEYSFNEDLKLAFNNADIKVTATVLEPRTT